MSDLSHEQKVDYTVEIVKSRVIGGVVEDLPEVIQRVYDALDALGQQLEPVKAPPSKPAVPIEESVFSDHIVCLEDGEKLKMLKRYLKTAYNMTPEQYRARWGLPKDYPMVAPGYAAKRSEIAKALGLGRNSVGTKELPGSAPVVEIAAEAKKRGRPRKVA